MEELAVAADVTGVFDIRCSVNDSSKVICETLDGIKDAPADVERLITAVSDLRSLLNQVEGLLNQNGLDGSNLPKYLELLIRSCAHDLDQFQKQNRFQASPDKKSWRRAWRRVKAVIEKERLCSMRMVVLQHHSAPGGYLAFANL